MPKIGTRLIIVIVFMLGILALWTSIAEAPEPGRPETQSGPVPTVTSTLQPGLTASPTALPTPAMPRIESTFPASITLPTPMPIYDPPVASVLPKPPQAPLVPQPPGTINILLLGSDRRPGEKVARTDTMILVAIEPETPSANLISFPRDLYVWIPSHGYERLNAAYVYGVLNHYPGGGLGLVKATFLYNFGIPIHYAALMDFEGFKAMIDAVGGIDVLVDAPLYDSYPDESEPTGWAHLMLDPGIYHMDGSLALKYVRSRKTTSDFDRNRRQQQVLRALYQQVTGPKLYQNLPAAWKAAQDYLETDLDFNTVMYLARLSPRLEARLIKSRMIVGYDVVYPWTTPSDEAVLRPYPEKFSAFLAEALTPALSNRLVREAPRVRIFENSGVFNCGILLRDALALRGFDVTWVFVDPNIIRTEIIDYNTTSKGSALPKLQSFLGSWLEGVVSQPLAEDQREAEFDLYIGPGFGLCLQK